MTLVILHGWGQSSENWKEFLSKFENIDILSLDLPGFGAEPLVDSEWGIPEYAKWVNEQIETRKLKDVVILGHSFGGRIASFISSNNPEWLNKLILYGAPSIYRPSVITKFKIRVAKILKYLGFNRATNNSELLVADKKGLGKIFRKVVNFDQTDLLVRINIPTLLVWGELDKECPLSIANEMNNLIKNSNLVVLDKLGHNAHLENPNLFYGTLKNFIQNY